MFATSNLVRVALLPIVLSHGAPAMTDDPSLAGVRTVFGIVRQYIEESAEVIPESLYDYRPSDDVRSIREILGHVANTAYLSCAVANSEQEPEHPDFEKSASKGEVLAALREAFDYCREAYQMSSPRVNESVVFGGQRHTRLSFLALNVAHEFEHYGNLVTYMRINGIVPPSSRKGP